MRLKTVLAVVGAILLLPVLAWFVLSAASGVSTGGGQSIDHEPISLEQANELIDGGQAYRVAIRAQQDVDEFCYFLLDADTSCQWEVNGENVHLFTDSSSTGTPILGDQEGEVGLTSAQLEDLLVHVNQYNATASSPIEVFDER